MTWQQNGPGWTASIDESPGGSVKRAREMVVAGLREPPPAPRPLLIQKSVSPRGPTPPTHSPALTHSNPQSIAGDSRSSSVQSSPRAPNSPSGQILRSSPLRPSGSGNNHWDDGPQDRDSEYSATSRPSTIATGTSEGTIPDFPVVPPIPPIPATNTHAQRRGPGGHPPSSRRGVSSYYSQSSFVPPIPEEMPDGLSLYTKNQGPHEDWGLANSAYPEEEDDEGLSPDSNDGQVKETDFGDQTSLVRGPPRTKSLQPFMDTIESGDESASQASSVRKVRREPEWRSRGDEKLKPGLSTSSSPYVDGIGRHAFGVRPNGRHPYSGYESDATFLDSPLSASPKTPKALKGGGSHSPGYFSGSPTSGGSPVDQRVNEILGHLEKGGALGSTASASSEGDSALELGTQKGFHHAPRQTNRPAPRPTTSLPDMIRRATKLASNLDRASRTNSRQGMLEMLDDKDLEKHKGARGSRGSITEMLAAFPSPSNASSPGITKPATWGRMSTHGRSNLSRSQTVTYGSSRSPPVEKQRRCCGLPLWVFILIIVITLLLLAAAVIIPVTLILIPKANNANAATLSSCQSSKACLNGGSSLVFNGTCQCVCAGNFVGSTCNVPSDGNCAVTSIQGQNTTIIYMNATFGSNLPRLLASATANYSIPVIGWKLATAFSANNMTCASENALVALNSRSSRRRRRHLSELIDLPNTISTPHMSTVSTESGYQSSPHRDATLPSYQRSLRSFTSWLDTHAPFQIQKLHFSTRREIRSVSSVSGLLQATKTLHVRASAQSSNGIVFAGDSGPSNNGVSVPIDAPPPASTAANPPTLGASSSGSLNITTSMVDFARTAVLLIFQESRDLAVATTAMNKLSTALSPGLGKQITSTSSTAGSSVDVGAGTLIDFVSFTVAFSNGTLIGGHAGG